MTKVLLLEDDLELGSGIKLSLEKEKGFDVVYISSVESALKHLLNDGFDTFILDLHTYDGGAKELLRRSNGKVKKGNIIIISGQDPTLNDYIELKRFGANDVLRKPFNLGQLTHLIDQKSHDRTHLLSRDDGIEYIVDALRSGLIPEIDSLVATGSRHTKSHTLPDELTDLDLDFVTGEKIYNLEKKKDIKLRLHNLMERASRESNYPLRGWIKDSHDFMSGKLPSESVSSNKKSPEISDLIGGIIADQTKITGVTLWGERFLDMMHPRIEPWQSWAYFISERYKLPKAKKYNFSGEEILKRIAKRALRWQYAVLVSKGNSLWDLTQTNGLEGKSFYDLIFDASRELFDGGSMIELTENPDAHLNFLEIALVLKTMSPAVYSINLSNPGHENLQSMNRAFSRDIMNYLKNIYNKNLSDLSESERSEINLRLNSYKMACRKYQIERG